MKRHPQDAIRQTGLCTVILLLLFGPVSGAFAQWEWLPPKSFLLIHTESQQEPDNELVHLRDNSYCIYVGAKQTFSSMHDDQMVSINNQWQYFEFPPTWLDTNSIYLGDPDCNIQYLNLWGGFLSSPWWGADGGGQQQGTFDPGQHSKTVTWTAPSAPLLQALAVTFVACTLDDPAVYADDAPYWPAYDLVPPLLTIWPVEASVYLPDKGMYPIFWVDKWNEELGRAHNQWIARDAPGPYWVQIEGWISPHEILFYPELYYTWKVCDAEDTPYGTWSPNPPKRLDAPLTYTPPYQSELPAPKNVWSLRLYCTDDEHYGETPIEVFKNCLERDRDNFGVNTSCKPALCQACYDTYHVTVSHWHVDRFPVGYDVTPPRFDAAYTYSWNCHGALWHAHDGSGSGYMTPPPISPSPWTTLPHKPNPLTYSPPFDAAKWQQVYGQLTYGEVISYYTFAYNSGGVDYYQLQHSATCVGYDASSKSLTYGANNQAPLPAGGQSWRWDVLLPENYVSAYNANRPLNIALVVVDN